ncbi:unnamed protein product [Dibothriocephalus latus]|uniref:Uncharacterized protein n=1 Tax=Dibothriocephalus latus TaxID=60516 RepID=A0A3P7N9L3_DIBLA|nr:unnamed protein product [Dibothriocephalus latus]
MGTPMGSPISGLIAEAVSPTPQTEKLGSVCGRHFFVIERDQVLTFKERLNAVFPDILFTMEEEEKNQLIFLDVLLCCRRWCPKNQSVRESNQHYASPKLQQQPPNWSQTQLRKSALPLRRIAAKWKIKLLNYNIFDGY